MVAMGWGEGINSSGRRIGYLVDATCDEAGCDELIDRGLAFACGGEHDGGADGCGRYFCGGHLCHPTVHRAVAGVTLPYLATAQLCRECAEAWQASSGEDGSGVA